MTNSSSTQYFRVFQNETSITEVFGNESQLPQSETSTTVDTSSPVGNRWKDYSLRSEAMEMAKAGALEYIDELIGQGESGLGALLQYRMDHYEDLNINLIYSNIENVKRTEEGLPIINIPSDHLV
ncbi:hypothetical protein [Mucilaginibacter sp. UYCu711]|uniref:hypothetical protein n=1 Tax=Mucilaginibacter sp. UYCu711 TaxID=3156339 RepID=UPI003D1EDC39